MTDPGTRRLESLDERSAYVATEIEAMADGQLAEQTQIDGQQFNHRAWAEAELRATADEYERAARVITADGGVAYDRD